MSLARLKSGLVCSLLAVGAFSACEDTADPGYQEDAGIFGEDGPLLEEDEDAGSAQDAGAHADAASSPDSATAQTDAGAPEQDAATSTEQDASAHETADASSESDAQQSVGEPFTAVYALLDEHCSGCHGAGKKLDLSTRELAFAGLVNAQAKYGACAADGGMPKVLVVPGEPEASLLIAKLENHQTCGKPMPPSSDPMNPAAALLPQASVDVLRAWVAAGAPEH